MDDKLYWVWLSLLFSYGSSKPDHILSLYDSPEDFYHLNENELHHLEFLTQSDVQAIKRVSLKRAQKIIDDCKRLGISIVTYGDELYPKRLRLIYGPPVVLYTLGDISGIDDEVAITVVGTRRATDYSTYVTEYLSYNLAQAGVIIVSGCAVGIDTAAHTGALKAEGRTVAVLGCGLDVNYPRENRELKKMILKKGALISELPPGTEASGRIFPVRNRIMAGLSLGALVTHAPERSGSLITAEHALEQGKEVFCVPPYSLFDSNFFGVIKYLRDGAIPVFCADDILNQYTGAYAHKLDAAKMTGDYIGQKKLSGKLGTISRPKADSKTAGQPIEKAPKIEDNKDKFADLIAGFDEKQLAVYHKLEVTPKYIDELSGSTGLKVSELLAVLTELEIMGVAESLGGQRYALNLR